MTSMLVTLLCAGCGGDSPTRTPVPTFTPTPLGAAVAPAGTVAPPAAPTDTVVVEMPTATETVTSEPPTSTPEPTVTPTVAATSTPVPTSTALPSPAPSPTPSFSFQLQVAEKHPTTSLAPNVVRIFLFVENVEGFGLPGYSLRVLHNGAELPVDKVSTEGVPGLTRSEPSPYTRFTNLNVIFVEAQAGNWLVQLIDEGGNPVGPAAEFNLTADEQTRELYVRYRVQ